ncbi:MAG: glycosyltransferase family 25 protein, partial [Rhodospirillaceae bacterium]|nr:glycosyltransferase family 25 protein [Rhodospirillaceae bacterium]MYI51190.1 glycosyltransferase family 25 protein [Rhodospirillaceae bacterium]
MSLPVYVINLDRDVERLINIRASLQQLGIPFTRFPAFLGTDIPDRWTSDFGRDNPMGAGQIGCYASHLQVIANILETDETARVILEDDCELSADFAEFLADIPEQLPEDWDIVRLSPSLKNLKRPVRRIATLREGRGLYIYSRPPSNAVGYIINRRFAEHFTKPVERRVSLDAHFRYLTLFGDLTCYGVYPPPVRQRASIPSSIDRVGRKTVSIRHRPPVGSVPDRRGF